eukprot:gene36219-59278_t
MARAVAAKGYADTTIADIVREASVSRRTFYENFADKAECLIALYEVASGNAIAVLRGAIDPHSDWQAQVEQAMGAYFGVLARNPVLLRTLFIDILGLGAPGLAARRRANQQLADLMMRAPYDHDYAQRRNDQGELENGHVVMFGPYQNEQWQVAYDRRRLDKVASVAVFEEHPIGVEVGGAVKNVMAIATGLADGLQLGFNARA